MPPKSNAKTSSAPTDDTPVESAEEEVAAPEGEMHEGNPVVTLETELWADAFPVKPPPVEGEWEAVEVKEYMTAYATGGIVVAYPGHFLVRELGAGSMDFVCLSPEAFEEQYTTV